MSNVQTHPLVLPLDDPSATVELVGGKGASLARLAAAKLPVPPGFHLTTDAYRRFVDEHGLQEQILALAATANSEQPEQLEQASREITRLFTQSELPSDIADAIGQAYRDLGGDDVSVAVRSSATAEDLPGMSFAGQQESYLNMRGPNMVFAAVKRCWASLWTARALSYRTRYGIAPQDVSLAVVVQQLIPAQAAGVLFTANPLTGARDQLLINAAWGLGESLVGGQVTPDTLIVERTSGKLISQTISEKSVMTVLTPDGTQQEAVPEDLRKRPVLNPTQVAELVHLGERIAELYARPMDIEWTLHEGRFWLVQARPITTLDVQTPEMEEWNDSLSGNYLWTCANLGEAVPDVMTPCTWSLIQIFMAKTLGPLFHLDASYPPIGNIGGRFYMNMSLNMSVSAAFGISRKRHMALSEEVFGRIPDDLEVPLIPLARGRVLRATIRETLRLRRRVRTNQKKLPAFLATAPARNEELRARIQAPASPADLLALWRAELEPFFTECCHMLEAGARQDGSALILARRRLRRLVGETDANTLLSGLGDRTDYLASLGPVLGLTQLANGEIDRETFARRYGHRCSYEFEISRPRPAENQAWIEQQLAGLHTAQHDASQMLARQQEARAVAWEHFKRRKPRRARPMQRLIERASAAVRDREAARSEVVRVFWTLRTFVLRAGDLTGQGEALFFLSIQEILALLAGDEAALASIPARRVAYQRYSELPAYPTLISGHFDPFAWAADPQRRSDIFVASGYHTPINEQISGFPGSAGIVEGRACVLSTVDEGDQLQAGEILVTTVTNIGWTPLFPRAAAIVTDVGAPLSHAAIVARELGIPAVVGCGNATTRLHTGDLLRVNGAQGTVEVLQIKT
jgi:pyruvate,water dikinase